MAVGRPHAYTAADFADVFTAAGLIPTALTSEAVADTLNGDDPLWIFPPAPPLLSLRSQPLKRNPKSPPKGKSVSWIVN